MRGEGTWIAAIAVGQLGIAIIVCGIVVAQGDAANAAFGPGGWQSLSASGALLLGGAMLVGAGVGAFFAGMARRHRAKASDAGADDTSPAQSETSCRLPGDAELKQLAEGAVGNPFEEVLRAVVARRGVQGAAFSTGEGLTLSAQLPQELSADQLSAVAPSLLMAGPDWLWGGADTGDEAEVLMRRGVGSVIVVARGDVLLSAIVDNAATENGEMREWLGAAASAGAKLWAARYGEAM